MTRLIAACVGIRAKREPFCIPATSRKVFTGSPMPSLRHLFTSISAIAIALIATSSLTAQETAPAATVLRRIPAAEARQGVASDAHYIYAISDSEIAKYDKSTGKRISGWKGDPSVYIHINSCIVMSAELVCAMSNFPHIPQAGSIEWFSTATMKHLRSHSLGPARGTANWIDWHDGSWWVGFANYDKRGNDPPRDHNATSLVRYSPLFVEQGAWLFPENVLDRFKPMSSSGGRWGPGNLLYVTGHDLAEMYVLRLPEGGPRLEYVRTIATPTNGQAFDWDYGNPGVMWSIERKQTEAVQSRLPIEPSQNKERR